MGHQLQALTTQQNLITQTNSHLVMQRVTCLSQGEKVSFFMEKSELYCTFNCSCRVLGWFILQPCSMFSLPESTYTVYMLDLTKGCTLSFLTSDDDKGKKTRPQSGSFPHRLGLLSSI